jgi:P27 family predicted phage terminase small subunit
MAAGRKPKPIALRLLEGNPGKRAINGASPKPPPLRVALPPDWFTESHLNKWNRLSPMLQNLGLLTEADYEALVRYVDFLVDYESTLQLTMRSRPMLPIYEYVKNVTPNEKGEMVETTQRRVKCYVQNPAYGMKKSISEHLLRIEGCFGMTPSDRARLICGVPNVSESEEDPFAPRARGGGK